MAKTVNNRVKGGWVKRDAETGRFVEVRAETRTSKSTPPTVSVLEEASSRRHAALKRLVNR